VTGRGAPVRGARVRACGAAACAAALALLFACAGKPPGISRALARVIYVRDVRAQTSAETLSVFLVPGGPGSIDDLSAFYVISDDAELFWKVESTQWSKSVAEGETWIGVNALSVPLGDSVPSGSYRVILQDAGGETAELTVTVPERGIAAAQAVYPSAEVKDGMILVSGPYDAPEVWAYDANGKFAGSFAAGKAAAQLEVARIAASSPSLSQGFSFRLYAWDEKAGFGVLAGPYQAGTLPAR